MSSPDSPLLWWLWGWGCCCQFPAVHCVCVLACTRSGRALPPCWVLCSRLAGGCGAWRTRQGSHSVVERGTGLVGRAGPWLQEELGPLGYPEWAEVGRWAKRNQQIRTMDQNTVKKEKKLTLPGRIFNEELLRQKWQKNCHEFTDKVKKNHKVNTGKRVRPGTQDDGQKSSKSRIYAAFVNTWEVWLSLKCLSKRLKLCGFFIVINHPVWDDVKTSSLVLFPQSVFDCFANLSLLQLSQKLKRDWLRVRTLFSFYFHRVVCLSTTAEF